MLKIPLSLILFFVFTLEIHADYFKWEIIVTEKGFGSKFRTIPVAKEGEIYFLEKRIRCIAESFWTQIESDLLLEGKTLSCNDGKNERKIQLVCRDNNKNRKYNKIKELYPVSKFGFLLYPELGNDSPYLELRCFF